MRRSFMCDVAKRLTDTSDLISAADVSLVGKSDILDHHPPNTSDHFPVKIKARWSTDRCDISPPSQRVHWKKAIEGGLRAGYAQRVDDIIRPLIGMLYPSIKSLDVEICMVVSKITTAASDYLPHTVQKKSKMKMLYIKNDALQSLYKEQKKARKRWSDAGKPRTGPLYEQQKALKRQVCQYLRDLRAAEEKWDIQKTDEMFHSHNHNCFRKLATRSPCSDRLMVGGSLITDRADVLAEWKRYFSELNTSQSRAILQIDEAIYTKTS